MALQRRCGKHGPLAKQARTEAADQRFRFRVVAGCARAAFGASSTCAPANAGSTTAWGVGRRALTRERWLFS